MKNRNNNMKKMNRNDYFQKKFSFAINSQMTKQICFSKFNANTNEFYRW